MAHGHRPHASHVTGLPLFRVLALATPTSAPGFVIETCAGWAEAVERLAGDEPFDAVMVDGDTVACPADEVGAIAERAALVIVVVEPDAEHAPGWLRRGADDVIGRDELAAASGWRRVRFAIERRRRGLEHRSSHPIDLGTGLPHRQQLLEHLSQLLALREREPAPMAVLGFRVERLGGNAAPAGEGSILRRKIALRLRAGVRASDVVAAIDDDTFALLLGSIVVPADGERVAAKLVEALVAPFRIAGAECSVAVAFGIARYPLDGKDAGRLLRRALALAAAAPATSRAGPTTVHDPGGGLRAAANDDR
jgi:GGDEF domain-containing protein